MGITSLRYAILQHADVAKNLLKCVVGKVFEAKYIQNVDRAAGALCEEAGVDAGDEPLEHLGVKQLGNRVATGVHLRNA